MSIHYMHAERRWCNARLASLAPSRPGLGVVEDALIACAGGRILYAGARADAPTFDVTETIDCGGRWITPGLIDCHTHLVHAGDRANEFEQRLAGVDYATIARQGGGIAATVRATRAASEAALIAQSLPRLDALLAEGVTSVEIKSGYGLELETELRQLRAARALADVRDVSVSTTFLGAHALPPGFDVPGGADVDESARAEAYIRAVCEDMIPTVARTGLADAVDAYCETIGFSAAQVERVIAAARAHGLRVKLHADQLSDLGGARLAAEARALSADHLEWTDEAGVTALADAGSVAVLLPAAFYFLRATRMPPIAALRRHHVPMAIATDCNPGTAPLTSPLLALNMAATLFCLTVEECLAGATREAARALGRLQETGTLEAGKWCDLAIWDIERPAELVYRMGFNPLHARVWHGRMAGDRSGQ